MHLRHVALLSGAIPLITINVSYWLARANGHVASCLPYIDGCTSVSATGRHPPEALLFRAGMISVAVLMVLYWKSVVEWLRCLGDHDTKMLKMMLFLGLVGSLFLVVYATALGYKGDEYGFMRRIGTAVYFLFSFAAQMIFALRLRRLVRNDANVLLCRIARVKFVLCVLMLTIGLSSLAIPAVFENKDPIQNMVAWNFSVLMMLFYATSYFAWRTTGFTVNFRLGWSNEQ